MGEFNMSALKLENLEKISILPSRHVIVDSSRRITLKGTKAEKVPMFDNYRLFYLEDGTVILRPLVLTEPENVIKAETVERIMRSVENAKQGKVGGTFNPDKFKDLLDTED
jgi:hypothetical protein